MKITIELESDDISLLREAIYSRQRLIDGLLDGWRTHSDSDDAKYLVRVYSEDKVKLEQLSSKLKMEYEKELKI